MEEEEGGAELLAGIRRLGCTLFSSPSTPAASWVRVLCLYFAPPSIGLGDTSAHAQWTDLLSAGESWRSSAIDPRGGACASDTATRRTLRARERVIV